MALFATVTVERIYKDKGTFKVDLSYSTPCENATAFGRTEGQAIVLDDCSSSTT